MKKPNLLAVDASSQNISIVLSCGNGVMVDFCRKIKFGASEIITYINKILKKACLSLKDIDAFVIGAGPGSFTGLRISFSLVKAFAIAQNKPIIAMNSFFSCAYPFRNKALKIGVITDARRNLVYSAYFKVKKGELKKEGKEKLIKLEELSNYKDRLFLTYDARFKARVLDIYKDIDFYPKQVYPQAKYMLPLARQYYAKNKFTPVEKLRPLYLYPKTCQIRGK